MKDYYDILQVSPSAPDEVIKSAYKAMARLYHPDSTKIDKAVSENKMAEINEAYNILGNPQKKKEYDAIYRNANAYEEKTSENQPHQQATSNNNHNSTSEYTKVQNDYVYNDATEKEESSGISGFFQSLGRSIIRGLEKNQQNIENAYINGMSMSDYELIYQYKKSKGAQREGLIRALEAKGLMWRDDAGRLIPTDEFKYYWNM